MEQEMSPKKKGKSPRAKTGNSGEQNSSEKPSKTSNGSYELAEAEQGVAEGITEEVQIQQDPQMGPATLESLEAREDFKRQLEAIMDATKVSKKLFFFLLLFAFPKDGITNGFAN